MVFVMSFANIHNAPLNECEASPGFKTVQEALHLKQTTCKRLDDIPIRVRAPHGTFF